MIKIIAFYLPQYHPTPNNDKWWGAGFTEWTNVAKAKPLFPGHYQPKIPADLGFYDLRLPEVRQKQVELAKEAGIYGFCYYHYWFGNGHQELERPFNEVVNSGEPDFPFCLCWANETWSRKFWNKDGAVTKSEILAKQEYFGEEDNRIHFESLKKAFLDGRYIKIDNKPVFIIYKPFDFVGLKEFMSQWNILAKEFGFEGMHFIAYSLNVEKEKDFLLSMGFNAICSCRLNRNVNRNLGWLFRKTISILFHTPRMTSYKIILPTLIGKEEIENNKVYPTLIPNWDHTPRSGVKGDLFTKSTPELFEQHAQSVFNRIKTKPDECQYCFLKSWNEWGEGNYMEPDLKFGKGYILALRNALIKES